MDSNNSNVGLLEAPERSEFSFEVTDVTGSQTVVASEVPPSISAGAVALALADRMSLPTDVPWTLRDERSAAFLDENVAIGDQIGDEARLTITPKTHLG